MSYKETPVKTVSRFSKTWNSQEQNSLIAELVSISQETHRKPDSYFFRVQNDMLIDPNTQKPVLDFVADGVEKEVAFKLQDWASQTNEGVALWISPPLIDEYPCAKVIIHKIAYTTSGEKVILNSAILFDADVVNPKHKRKTLYTITDDDQNIFKIISWIKRKTQKDINLIQTTHHTKQRAVYFANQIRTGVPHHFVIQQMQESGFLGKNSISCPNGKSSFSNITTLNSEKFIFSGLEDEYGSLNFDCPTCGTTNTRPVGQLIPNCQHCGADVSC